MNDCSNHAIEDDDIKEKKERDSKRKITIEKV